MEIRGFIIKYSKRKAKKYRDEEKSLHKKVNDLQARSENNPHNKNIIFELQRARSCLKKIMLTKIKGAVLRSKVRWDEQGERNTKYFYSLEKRITILKQCQNSKMGEILTQKINSKSQKKQKSFMSHSTAPAISIPKMSVRYLIQKT